MGQAMSKILIEAKDNPQGFWAQAAKDVVWIEPPKTILEDSNPPFTIGLQVAKLMAVITLSTGMFLKAGAIKRRLYMIALSQTPNGSSLIMNC